MSPAARLAVIAAAGLTLAACGHAAPSSTAHPATHAATHAAATCRQQYETWKQAGKPEARRLVAALRRVKLASSAMDIPVMTSALHQAGTDAAVLARTPMPRCADPRGLYGRFLARITAAGDNAQAGSGLGALLLAALPLKGIQGIESRLAAELNRTVGPHY